MTLIAYAAEASAAAQAAQGFVDKINQTILFPLITLLMAMAFLVFLWGCFEYIRDAASDSGREKGKTHILWGTIGMLVMLSAYAILNLAAGTFGIDLPSDPRQAPTIGVTPSGGGGAYTPSSTGGGGTFTVTAASLQPVYNALIAGGQSNAMADGIIAALQISNSRSSLQGNLNSYVSAGVIDQSVADQVMAQY